MKDYRFKRTLKIRRENVVCENLPDSFKGLRILHISDLHKAQFGEDNIQLVKEAEKLRPHIIIITGDLMSRNEINLDRKVRFAEKLIKIAPVYFCVGNHEIYSPAVCNKFCNSLKNVGVHILRNNNTRLIKGNDFINIYGIDLPIKFYKNPDGSYINLPQAEFELICQLLGEKKEGFTILLAHSPFEFEKYAQWGADLVASGHVHGGVVRLPFVGGILSPERKFMPAYTKGIYTSRSEKSKLLLSAGLGKFRMMNSSELVVYTLQ